MSINGSVRKKSVYSSKFKLERALEAISSDNISETARKYNLGTNLLCLWKKQLLERGTSVFDKSPDQSVNELKAKVSRLEQMIGKKEIELNLLKNFSDFYSSRRDT
jgi:transposase